MLYLQLWFPHPRGRARCHSLRLVDPPYLRLRVSYLGLGEQETKGTLLPSCPQQEAEEPDQPRQILENPSLRQLSHQPGAKLGDAVHMVPLWAALREIKWAWEGKRSLVEAFPQLRVKNASTVTCYEDGCWGILFSGVWVCFTLHLFNSVTVPV